MEEEEEVDDGHVADEHDDNLFRSDHEFSCESDVPDEEAAPIQVRDWLLQIVFKTFLLNPFNYFNVIFFKHLFRRPNSHYEKEFIILPNLAHHRSLIV